MTYLKLFLEFSSLLPPFEFHSLLFLPQYCQNVMVLEDTRVTTYLKFPGLLFSLLAFEFLLSLFPLRRNQNDVPLEEMGMITHFELLPEVPRLLLFLPELAKLTVVPSPSWRTLLRRVVA